MLALVTGAAGYIASAVVDRHLADGHQTATVLNPEPTPIRGA